MMTIAAEAQLQLQKGRDALWILLMNFGDLDGLGR
jgi:hypothetical protein